MSSFNQGVPGPATLINSSNCIVLGNTTSGTALTVQQLGAGAVMNVATSTGSSALFVSSTGQVGVGTGNPATALDVFTGTMNAATVVATTLTGAGSGITSLNMGNAGSGTLAVARGGTGVTSSTGTGSVVLSASPALSGTATFAAITTSGNVGIGVTNPAVAFVVNSTSGMQCTGTYSCQCYYGWTVYNGQGTQVVLVNHVSNGDVQGWNAAAAIMNIGRANTTARSVSAGGTINASGADYAEYMTKTNDFAIKKGDMVGVNAQGLLTTVFADSVSFMVKSTDPSYVGGDTWGSEDVLGMKRPESTPQKEGESDEDYAKRQQDLALFNANLEEARARVDRIAFAGQVPVNVLGATPGQYIVPVANEDGSISGQAVSKPTIEQYMAAVGKVIKILPDGRAQIIVKVV